jgi:7-cyano-7-deazaguanine reductase
LGRTTVYPQQYDASLLHPVPRHNTREEIGIGRLSLPFTGVDIWNAYELSWLNAKGLPVVAAGVFEVPCQSPSLIESKSLKLYLNSFNQTRFASAREVQSLLQADLSRAAGLGVTVRLCSLDELEKRGVSRFKAHSLDHLDVEIHTYQPDAALLALVPGAGRVSEALCSDLLKSNCPVTGQPDWGSILVDYTGARLDRSALLKYLVSFRQHNDFHEHCVERIFVDLQRLCQPDKLTVYARYVRRGGLDINPYRTIEKTFQIAGPRLARQ